MPTAVKTNLAPSDPQQLCCLKIPWDICRLRSAQKQYETMWNNNTRIYTGEFFPAGLKDPKGWALEAPAGSCCGPARAGSLWLHLQIPCHWPQAPLRRRPSLSGLGDLEWSWQLQIPDPSNLSHVGVLRMVSTANHRSSQLAAEWRSNRNTVQRVLFWWRL